VAGIGEEGERSGPPAAERFYEREDDGGERSDTESVTRWSVIVVVMRVLVIVVVVMLGHARF
jgi:hypothetical protein